MTPIAVLKAVVPIPLRSFPVYRPGNSRNRRLVLRPQRAGNLLRIEEFGGAVDRSHAVAEAVPQRSHGSQCDSNQSILRGGVVVGVTEVGVVAAVCWSGAAPGGSGAGVAA